MIKSPYTESLALKKTIGQRIDLIVLKIQDYAVLTIFLATCFGGIIVVMYQCYLYLSEGFWTSISLLDLIFKFIDIGSGLRYWAAHPTSWIGLHKILTYLPLSLTSIVGGYVFFFFADSYMTNRRDEVDSKHRHQNLERERKIYQEMD